MNAQNFVMNNDYTNANNNSMNPFLNQYNSNYGFNNLNANNNNFNIQNNNIIQNIPNNNINNNNIIQNNQLNNNQNFNQVLDNDLRNKIQKNNSKMNLDNFWIDINQIGILYSIIDFYHKSKNYYLDINEKVQIMNIINRLNPDISSIKQNNEICDPLYYINEPKKIIKFINSDFNLYNVKVPISLTKLDLYSIARTYKSSENKEILLIHKNNIIKEDESSINFITDNDYVIIIENRNYPDNSFYESLIKNNPDHDKIHIIFVDDYKYIPDISMHFPSNITFFQMMKAFNYKIGCCIGDNSFINYSFQDENKTLKEIFTKPYNNLIHYYRAGQFKNLNNDVYGKKIDINITDIRTNKNLTNIACLGLLNSNKLLVQRIESETIKKVKKIIFNGKILNIGDEMSIKSLGIQTDAFCFVELE